jgi:hypothetical protein
MFDEPRLHLEAVWSDEHLLELQVSASNGRFGGVTEVYTSVEDVLDFAARLEGFPTKVTDVVEFSAGESDSYAFVRLKFYCADALGHAAVQVVMEERTASDSGPEAKDKAVLKLRHEPAAIDRFRHELRRMASNQTGSATLTGV